MLVAKGISGCGRLHSYGCGYLASVDHVYILSGVGVHCRDASESFVLLFGRVVDRRAILEHAAIDPQERARSESISDDLERQRAEWLVVRRLALNVVMRSRIDSRNR